MSLEFPQVLHMREVTGHVAPGQQDAGSEHTRAPHTCTHARTGHIPS